MVWLVLVQRRGTGTGYTYIYIEYAHACVLVLYYFSIFVPGDDMHASSLLFSTSMMHHMFGFMLSRVAIFIPSDASHCICKAIVVYHA